MEFKDYIKNEMKEENIPVLFIGSGLTKRYCLIDGKMPPNWEELLKIAVSIYSSEEFHYDLLERSIEHDIPAALKYQRIAQKIEEEFNTATLRKELVNKEYEDKILEEYRKDNKLSPFKIFIGIFFSKIEITKDPILLDEIEKLKSLVKKSLIILTTNYDKFLEMIFPEYKVIKGQELISSRCVASIFKIHGCVTDPRSIVITEEDYKNISNRKKVLNARLITFFAEHPVFFLGYSLEDLNIQEFVDNIYVSFEEDKETVSKIAKKFVVIEWKKDEKTTIVQDTTFMKKFRIPLKKIETDNFEQIFSEFKKLNININIKELALVENIFLGAIKGNKSNNLKMVNVSEASEDQNLSQDVIIGYGVNILNSIYNSDINYFETIGYKSKNIIIPPEDFMKVYLPDLLKRNSRGLHPFIKYFSQCYNESEKYDSEIIKKVYLKLKSELKLIEDIEIIEEYKNINQLMSSNLSNNKKENCIKKHYLAEIFSEKETINYIKGRITKENSLNTFLRKLIAIVDYKKYSTVDIISKLEEISK